MNRRYDREELESVSTSQKGGDAMGGQGMNRISGRIILVLSLIALISLLSGYTQPPQPDEGPVADIFQLSILALAPMILLFFGTANWNQPREVCVHWDFPPQL
jgi:hypothetical protein